MLATTNLVVALGWQLSIGILRGCGGVGGGICGCVWWNDTGWCHLWRFYGGCGRILEFRWTTTMYSFPSSLIDTPIQDQYYEQGHIKCATSCKNLDANINANINKKKITIESIQMNAFDCNWMKFQFEWKDRAM